MTFVYPSQLASSMGTYSLSWTYMALCCAAIAVVWIASSMFMRKNRRLWALGVGGFFLICQIVIIGFANGWRSAAIITAGIFTEVGRKSLTNALRSPDLSSIVEACIILLPLFFLAVGVMHVIRWHKARESGVRSP